MVRRTTDRAGSAIGDESSFEVIANGCSSRLFGIALAILVDRGEAEDAVQEALWKAWRARDRAPEPDRTLAWMIRICVNHCLDRRSFLSRRGFRRHAGADRIGASPGVAHSETTTIRLDVRRGFDALSSRQRAAIALRHCYGYSLDDCADLMGCSVNTVRTHMSRGLRTLRKELTG